MQMPRTGKTRWWVADLSARKGHPPAARAAAARPPAAGAAEARGRDPCGVRPASEAGPPERSPRDGRGRSVRRAARDVRLRRPACCRAAVGIERLAGPGRPADRQALPHSVAGAAPTTLSTLDRRKRRDRRALGEWLRGPRMGRACQARSVAGRRVRATRRTVTRAMAYTDPHFR